ncbi:zinc finger protein 880-like [Harpegnathos saltator]|uniref:zinc finger protein 880-like n=1 Tax=Harpegnathos saltator TaxID=610380 RepID=UPI000DBEDCC5|nr:zinc finger protein 880-like [Harpegnathos saltator]
MDMIDLAKIVDTNKWSRNNYQSSKLQEDLLNDLRCLPPSEQEGSNVTQPGPSSVSDPCGDPPTRGSDTNKYNKISKQCDICKQIFRRRHELMDHCEKVHKRSMYKCDRCDYETNHKNHLKRHEKIHVKKRPTNSGDYVCTEPGCNKRYKNKHDFICHIKICQYKNKMKSNNMGTGPSSESNLYFRKKKEMYELSRQCRICDQMFRNKKMLIDHSMKVHQHCVHICEDKKCNYETNKLRDMQKHFVRMHTTNKN